MSRSGAEDELPPIILGAWQLSAGHRVHAHDEATAFEALARAADRGFGAIDCADIYTGVEAQLGRFLTWYRNRSGSEAAERIRIHTKVVPDRDALAALRRADVEKIVDRSLARLGRDRLDLVQFAWWDYTVPGYVDLGLWLEDQMRAGKIGCLGATNFDTPRLTEVLDAGVPVELHQVQYSLLDRRPAGPMAELCRQRDVRLLAYGTLAGGLLTNRYLSAARPEEPVASRSLRKYLLIVDEFGGWPALQRLLGTMRRIADDHGATVSQVALRYALTRPHVEAAIVGLTTWDRLSETLDGASVPLSDEAQAALEGAVASARGPTGPVFGIERVGDGPHGRIMKYNLNRDARPAR